MDEKVQLTQTDLRILGLMSKNGILNENELAAKLKLNPSTVSYKIKKYWKEGVIKSYRLRINYSKLGYNAIAWVFIKLKKQTIDLEEFMGRLIQKKNILGTYYITGQDAFVLRVWAKDIFSLSKFINAMNAEFKNEIRSNHLIYWTKPYKLHQIIVDDNPNLPKIDVTDLKILNEMHKNPTLQIKEIAKNLRLHRNTVSSRWKKIIKKGIILKKNARLNPKYFEDFGINFKAIVLFDVATSETDNVAKELAKHEEIHELTAINSMGDIAAIIRTKNINEFYNFLKRIFSDKKIGPKLEDVSTRVILKGKTTAPDFLEALLESQIPSIEHDYTAL